MYNLIFIYLLFLFPFKAFGLFSGNYVLKAAVRLLYGPLMDCAPNFGSHGKLYKSNRHVVNITITLQYKINKDFV